MAHGRFFDKNHIYEGKNSEKLQKYLKAKH